MADPQILSAEIDQLLEHYLGLLDQYTTLRSQLSTVQASIQQNIARANFTADRGIRYGGDCYDERMQATRICEVSGNGFKVHLVEETQAEGEKESQGETSDEASPATEKQPSGTTKKSKDPLRMFGILTPQALRTAQSEAVKLVEDIIPQIATVNAEMEKTEIEIRRKRKYKAKAEAKSTVGEVEKGIPVECAR